MPVEARHGPIFSPTGQEGKGSERDERKSEPDLQFLADFPAVVLDVKPKLGATDVDPSLKEIRVTFSKKMKDQNWSWVTYDREMFPTVEGKIHYEADRTDLRLTGQTRARQDLLGWRQFGSIPELQGSERPSRPALHGRVPDQVGAMSGTLSRAVRWRWPETRRSRS